MTALRPSALCLIAAASLAGCSAPRVAPADTPLLRLGEQEVPSADFDAYLQSLEARDGPVDADVRQNLLESFLEERVLVLEARRQGLVEPGDPAEKEQAAVQQLLAGTVLPGVEVTEDEVLGYYDQHGEELGLPETITLRQVLVPTLNEARDVHRRLRKDRRSFGLLARTRSRGPEAGAGGLMGVFERGQLPPELESVAFGLSPGNVGPIVESPLGFHVLLVESRNDAHPRTLEECRDEIRNLLVRRAFDAAVRRYIAGLLARAEVNHEAVTSNPRPLAS